MPSSTSAPLFNYDEVCSVRVFLPRVNNTLEPPSPELREKPLESGAPPPDSSPEQQCTAAPPIMPPIDMPDPRSTSENPTSPEGNRRTIGDWFRTVVTKRSHNRPSRQPPSEAPPQSGIPSQLTTTPPNEKPSTMSPGKRIKVSVPFSVDRGYGCLTTRLSGRLESPLLDPRLVHASSPFMNITTYCAPQKKAAPRPAASSQPPKTTPHSEASPVDAPNESKAEPSGAQNNVEVRVSFVHLATGAHSNSCSEELGD